MSVYEPLRDVVTAVHENCSMGCDQRCAGGVGAYEVERKIYKSCMSGDLVGRSWRQMSGHVG